MPSGGGSWLPLYFEMAFRRILCSPGCYADDDFKLDYDLKTGKKDKKEEEDTVNVPERKNPQRKAQIQDLCALFQDSEVTIKEKDLQWDWEGGNYTNEFISINGALVDDDVRYLKANYLFMIGTGFTGKGLQVFVKDWIEGTRTEIDIYIYDNTQKIDLDDIVRIDDPGTTPVWYGTIFDGAEIQATLPACLMENGMRMLVVRIFEGGIHMISSFQHSVKDKHQVVPLTSAEVRQSVHRVVITPVLPPQKY